MTKQAEVTSLPDRFSGFEVCLIYHFDQPATSWGQRDVKYVTHVIDSAQVWHKEYTNQQILRWEIYQELAFLSTG